MPAQRPWLRFYGKVAATLTYPAVTLYQAVANSAARVPGALAWDFFDTTQTYREFLASIDACADALGALGLKAGERILISMPTAPQGANALRVHADGRTWLHTGDLGRMDADGFFYFTVRLKRLIKSSGFNVYPAQVEAVLYQHPLVAEACVIGVPDPSQVERVKAYVVLKGAAPGNTGAERALIGHCRERLIKWSCPREIEFRGELPKTQVGKIDYKLLVRQHAERRNATGAA